ncbi:unnamed protein product [Leuciscus chuanchicus]
MSNISVCCGEIESAVGFVYVILHVILNHTLNEDCEQSWYSEDRRLIADPSDPETLSDPVISVSSDRLVTSRCVNVLHEILCDASGSHHSLKTMFRVRNETAATPNSDVNEASPSLQISVNLPAPQDSHPARPSRQPTCPPLKTAILPAPQDNQPARPSRQPTCPPLKTANLPAPQDSQPVRPSRKPTCPPLKTANLPAPQDSQPVRPSRQPTCPPLKTANLPAPQDSQPARPSRQPTSPPLKKANLPAPQDSQPVRPNSDGLSGSCP